MQKLILDNYPILRGNKTVTESFNVEGAWGVQFIWSGLDKLDGTITPKQSIDGINFSSFSGDIVIPLNAAAGNNIIDFGYFSGNYLQFVISVGTAIAGVLTIVAKFEEKWQRR